MVEHGTQTAILNFFARRGLWCVRLNSGTFQNAATGSWIRGAPKGTCDIIACAPDRTVMFIEVKSPVGHLDMAQISFFRERDEDGHRWVVADSLEDVQMALDDPGYHGKTKHVDKVRSDKWAPRFSAHYGKGKRVATVAMLHEIWDKMK